MASHFHSLDPPRSRAPDPACSTSSLLGNAFLSRQSFPSLTNPFSSSNGSSLLPMPLASCPILPEPSPAADDSCSAWFNAAGILLSLKHAAIERTSRRDVYNEKRNFNETPMTQRQHTTETSGYQAEMPAENHVIDMRLTLRKGPEVWRQNLATRNSSRDGRADASANRCHVCSKVYARPSTLRTHMRSHRGEKPYKCNICSKSFTQDTNLRAHLRVHSGEKPFKCQVCERRFAQSSSVTTHMRTHTGERPYICTVCSRAFADSSTLTKHTRTHTGEKPYQCKICHMRFSQSGNQNRHMRVHSTN